MAKKSKMAKNRGGGGGGGGGPAASLSIYIIGAQLRVAHMIPIIFYRLLATRVPPGRQGPDRELLSSPRRREALFRTLVFFCDFFLFFYIFFNKNILCMNPIYSYFLFFLSKKLLFLSFLLILAVFFTFLKWHFYLF
jgi:hypothetical protein